MSSRERCATSVVLIICVGCRYGVYLIYMRLLQTSVLVFFPNRITKALVATAAAVLSMVLAQKFKPWLRDSDDQVAEVASYVVFLWLFALLAYDGLLSVHPALWGTPLVLAVVYLVGFALWLCYIDIVAFEKEIEMTQKNKKAIIGAADDNGTSKITVTDEGGTSAVAVTDEGRTSIELSEIAEEGVAKPRPIDVPAWFCHEEVTAEERETNGKHEMLCF